VRLKKCSKKSELLAHFLYVFYLFFVVEIKQKNLKIGLPQHAAQPWVVLLGLFDVVFQKKWAFSWYEKSRKCMYKVRKQLTFFTMHFVGISLLAQHPHACPVAGQNRSR
jgi:hypothetical protein